MTLKIDDSNYNEYKKVFEILWDHQSKIWRLDRLEGVPGPLEMINAREQESKALAKRSLKMGLNDLLVTVKHLSAATWQAIDTDLKKHNLPSIAELTGSVIKTIQKVLKRKKIATENEYYLVKEFMMFPEDDQLTEEERTLLYEYLDTFGKPGS